MSDRTKGYIFALITVILWSGWMLVSRVGAQHSMSAFDICYLRYTSAGLMMLPIAIRNRHIITKENWLPILIMTIGAGAPYLMFTGLGFARAPAAHGLVTPSSMTVFVAILSFYMFGEKVRPIRIVGYALIIFGVVYKLFTHESGGLASSDLFFLAAGFMWALYTVQKKKMHNVSALVATSFVACASMIALAIPYGIYQLVTPHELPTVPAIQQIIYQGFFTSVVSLITYNRAVHLIGPAHASSFAALVPLMVTLAAIPLLGEIPTAQDIVFVILMTFGVFLASGVLKFRRAVTP